MTDISIDYSQEIWKPVVHYEGFYEVSDFGRIRSIDRTILRSNGHSVKNIGKIKYIEINKYGYCTTCLNKPGSQKRKLIHRLVAESFLGIDDRQIDHKNGNRSDNRLANLEYVTRVENVRRGKNQTLENADIYFCKTGLPWKVCMKNGNSTKTYGRFTTLEKAILHRDTIYKQIGRQPQSKIKNTDFS